MEIEDRIIARRKVQQQSTKNMRTDAINLNKSIT